MILFIYNAFLLCISLLINEKLYYNFSDTCGPPYTVGSLLDILICVSQVLVMLCESSYLSRPWCESSWCVSYLSGRAGAVAQFGSRLRQLEQRWSLQAAATAVGGDTPSVRQETSALRLRLLLLPAALSRSSLIFTGGRSNQLVTSHSGLQLTGGKNDKEEVKNYYFLHTLAAWTTFAACQFVDSSMLPWNFVQIFVRMTLVIPWSLFVTETNGIPVSLSWTFCLFFMRKC